MKFWLRIFPGLLALCAALVIGVLAVVAGAYYYLRPSLPSADTLRDVQLQTPLKVYSRDGRLLAQLGEKRRTPVDYEGIPDVVVKAFLAAEDDRFFEHPGFDYQGITRAALNLLMTGSKSQGGSTITQQLARVYFLTRERTFVRKAKEIFLAMQIESEFSKEEILSLYMNKIFLGQRAYGVGAAAEVYFGKTLEELNLAEAATIAGIPKAPSVLNPVSNVARASERRAYVLRRMLELDFVDESAYESAIASPVESRRYGPKVEFEAPYATEMVRSEMVQRFGLDAYTTGYKVTTTIDSRLQTAAQRALRTALLEYDRRHGFRGPLDRDSLSRLSVDAREDDAALQGLLGDYPDYRDLYLAVVLALNEDDSAEMFVRDQGRVTVAWDSLRWRAYVNDNSVGPQPQGVGDMLAVGDVVYLLSTAERGWVLGQMPEAQGAFVALDPQDGATAALTGGFDFFASKFNRAVQAKRQPGSSFKPFIYSAALENGFTTATLVNDAPVVFDDSTLEDTWRPENYSRRFHGPTRLREALVRSLNLVSVRVLLGTGLGPALRHLRPFGLPSSALPRDPSMALGSGGASPWDLAAGYAVFASGGYRVEHYLIERVEDADGNVIFETNPRFVCQNCEDRWVEERQPPESRSAVAELTQTDASEADATLPLLQIENEPQFDDEVPPYRDVAAMIAHGLEWRPDSAETPGFYNANANPAERVITAENAYLIYDMMRDVIQRGTGQRARVLQRPDLAGKTGTSNDRRDAWFSGYNRNLVATAWVGFDQERSLGAREEGSRTALPMWIAFMSEALDTTTDGRIPQPEGIVTVRIVPDSGLVAPAGYRDAIFEIFREGHVPEQHETVIMPGGTEEIFGGLSETDEPIF
jgi:penicillin-binding protein 1A